VVEEEAQIVEGLIHHQMFLGHHPLGLESEGGPLRDLQAYPHLQGNASGAAVIRLRDLDLVPQELLVRD
jgi:hypothetical protein